MKGTKKNLPKTITFLEKLVPILTATTATGLLVLYLFFTKEQTGREGTFYPLFLLFPACGVVAAILSVFIILYEKKKQ